MKKRRPAYRFWQVSSVILMIVTLAWLTMSLPYVYEAGKLAAKTQAEEKSRASQNPLTNTTEENSNGSLTIAEEFLHDGHHELDSYITRVTLDYYHENESAYIAFHGELLSPPPDASC